MSNVYRGVWTPWAAVLCHGCHGNHRPVRVTLDKLLPLKDKPESHCKCDGCGQHIFCGEEVTVLASLRDTLRGTGIKANMHQTGGMCAALHIPLSEFIDGPYLACCAFWADEHGWAYELYHYADKGDDASGSELSRGDRASAMAEITKLVKGG